jgi:hypothetical protein
MNFYTTLQRPALEEIAKRMGIELYNYDTVDVPKKYAAEHRVGHKFVLRPYNSERFQRGGTGIPGTMSKNKIWAVSWAGHYVFMRAVLVLDNQAVIKTAIGIVTGDPKPCVYRGLEEFDICASITGEQNVGSNFRPEDYQDSQAKGHVEWDDEDDLKLLSQQMATNEMEAA